MHIGSYFADEPHHHCPFISRTAFITFQSSDAEGWLCFFFGQTTNGDTWVLKTANQVGNPGQAAFTAGHLRSLLNYHFPAMTDIEYDLPVITIPPNIQTRRIQHLCGVASSSLLTEIECL